MDKDITERFVKVFLVLKAWAKKDGTTGSDYCFTNRVPREDGSIAGHAYSISWLSNNKQANASDDACFAWLNGMTLDMYTAFVEEHGDFAWAEKDTSNVITNADYLSLFPQAESAQPQPQAF